MWFPVTYFFFFSLQNELTTNALCSCFTFIADAGEKNKTHKFSFFYGTYNGTGNIYGAKSSFGSKHQKNIYSAFGRNIILRGASEISKGKASPSPKFLLLINWNSVWKFLSFPFLPFSCQSESIKCCTSTEEEAVCHQPLQNAAIMPSNIGIFITLGKLLLSPLDTVHLHFNMFFPLSSK